MSGKIYDSSAYNRIDDFLNQQENEFVKLDQEESNKKDLLRYSIIFGSVVLSIAFFALIMKKLKKK